MPRRKSPPVFKIPDDTTQPKRSLKGVPPQQQAKAVVMSDDGKRDSLAATMAAYCNTLTVSPVKSNAELMERGTDYFRFCAKRRLFPTIEGLASYCGYAVRTLLSWQNHERPGFHDGEESTAQIVERLKGVIDATDGELVMRGEIPAIPWIFKRKATSGWVEAQKLTIETTAGGQENKPLSIDEIAKRLPDPDADYQIGTEDYK